MNLTEYNFCPHIENSSTQIRLMYICKKTGKLCPQIDYSTGKALPKTRFIKNGCALNKKEEIEEIKVVEKKETIPTPEIKKEKMSTNTSVKKNTTQRKKKTNKK